MSRRLKLYLIPILILLAVTLPHLDQGDFRRDTVRYAAISHYMYSGGSLLTPYANAEKMYFNKPPVGLWIHGFFMKWLGRNLIAARLPSILAAIGVLILSMLCVRNLGTQREAVVSGIVLASTYEFFRRTREISIDMWQLFFLMIAVWLVTWTLRTGKRWPLVLCGIPIGLGLMCKQFVALIALPIFAVWVAIAGQAQLMVWLFVGALPISILVAAPWHFYMYALFGRAFTDRYFGHEVVEYATRKNQTSTIFYYVRENVRTYWPWMLGLIYALYLRIMKRGLGVRRHVAAFESADMSAHSKPRRGFVLLALVWVGVWFIAISLFVDKKPNYALPLFPMLSWIVAWALCRLPIRPLRSWYERGLPWLAPAAVVLFLIAALSPIRFHEPAEKNWAKLIGWLQQNNIDAGTLAHSNLEQNDICYVYLKTGKWMKDKELISSPSPGLLVVAKFPKEEKPAEYGEVFFSSGPVHVVSLGP